MENMFIYFLSEHKMKMLILLTLLLHVLLLLPSKKKSPTLNTLNNPICTVGFKMEVDHSQP